MNYIKKHQFSTFDNVQLDIDVYYDDLIETEEALPAIVWFFGGGWTHGSITNNLHYGNYFASRGIVVVSPDYRTYNNHKASPTVCVKDAKYALKWTYDHADELGIDRNRIAVAGGSAGGHLSACCCILDKLDETDIDVTHIPKAQILLNGALDTSSATGVNRPHASEEEFERLSPLQRVRENLPPAALFHGTADDVVPYRQSAEFCGRMNEYGNKAILYSYAGKGHGFDMFEKDINLFADVATKAEKFLWGLGFGPIKDKF